MNSCITYFVWGLTIALAYAANGYAEELETPEVNATDGIETDVNSSDEGSPGNRDARGGLESPPLPYPGILVPLHRVRTAAVAESPRAILAMPTETNHTPWHTLLGGEGRLTSAYGPRSDPFSGRDCQHNGIDLAAPRGTSVYPMAPGTVTFSGRMSGYGTTMVVKHADGTETLYAHLGERIAKRGEVVRIDTPIAEVGSSGRSTGPHLHFEVRKHGERVDPMPVLEKRQKPPVRNTYRSRVASLSPLRLLP
jgi:murein DD-endopeptidase MepM/ murein hydrolase activator NlpD